VNDNEEPFEGQLATLEATVRRLESGDVPLEEALALFEKGVSLARGCHALLDAAVERVAALSRGPHGTVDRPLPEPSSSEPE
jgi:exodeoxyribonuclease VII small subunit